MLLGKYALVTVWLYCRDLKESIAFYRDRLGLRLIDEHDGTAHFDAGGIRLSLHLPEGEDGPPRGSFLVFLIPDGIEAVHSELVRRGVRFEGPLADAPFGRVASFRDPDGHLLYIWQPPKPDDSRFPMVAPLVEHYQSVSARLGIGA